MLRVGPIVLADSGVLHVLPDACSVHVSVKPPGASDAAGAVLSPLFIFRLDVDALTSYKERFGGGMKTVVIGDLTDVGNGDAIGW